MESWRGRLGVLASRGETSGPRVDEANAAMSNWRVHNLMVKEWGMSANEVDALIDATVAAPKTPGAPR